MYSVGQSYLLQTCNSMPPSENSYQISLYEIEAEKTTNSMEGMRIIN